LNKEFGIKTGVPFSIYTKMSCNRVIDIVGNTLVLKRKNGFKSQKWIFNDDDRTIQSVEFQDQSMGLHATGKNRAIEMQKTSNKWFQSFKFINGNIVNARGLVLNVEGNKCTEGSNVIAWKKHNGKNQRWVLKYNDSDVQRKGNDSYFGLTIDRPFYAFCKGLNNKVIEVVGGRNLALRDFSRNKDLQQFYLDA